MLTTLLISMVLAGSTTAVDPCAAAPSSEDAAKCKDLVATIEATYFMGTRTADGQAVDKLLYPELNLYFMDGGKFDKLPKDEWIKRIDARRGRPGVPDAYERRVVHVETRGDIAVAEIALSTTRSVKEFALFAKIDGAWRMVGKLSDYKPAIPVSAGK